MLYRFSWAAVAVLALCPGAGLAQGLAAQYPGDVGLGDDPAVLYFLDFDSQTETRQWTGDKAGYGWTDEPSHVFAGGGALEIQQTVGTHDPYEIHPAIAESDQVYVRWYRKWEPGYDFRQHKMPGVYARAAGLGGGNAGVVPDGTDKYSCKLYVDWDRHPRFYSYHPEQPTQWGDSPHMNLVDPKVQVEADRWYCFEMMIKANDPPDRNGELKMWIDGQLVGHIQDMRFRDVASLKINEFTYSAYVGGDWTTERDQKLWDDQIVVATRYIGPLVTAASPDGGPSPADAGGDGGAGGVDGAVDGAVGAADASGSAGDAAATRDAGGGASGAGAGAGGQSLRGSSSCSAGGDPVGGLPSPFTLVSLVLTSLALISVRVGRRLR